VRKKKRLRIGYDSFRRISPQEAANRTGVKRMARTIFLEESEYGQGRRIDRPEKLDRQRSRRNKAALLGRV